MDVLSLRARRRKSINDLFQLEAGGHQDGFAIVPEHEGFVPIVRQASLPMNVVLIEPV